MFDEADLFIESGFKNLFISIIKEYLLKYPGKKYMFVSASFTDPLNNCLNEVFDHRIIELHTFKSFVKKNTVDHQFIDVKDFENKIYQLKKDLKEYKQARHENIYNKHLMIFINEISQAESISDLLKTKNLPFVTVSSSIDSSYKNDVFEILRQPEPIIIISTNFLARGFDFPFLSKIINFDFPK